MCNGPEEMSPYLGPYLGSDSKNALFYLYIIASLIRSYGNAWDGSTENQLEHKRNRNKYAWKLGSLVTSLTSN